MYIIVDAFIQILIYEKLYDSHREYGYFHAQTPTQGTLYYVKMLDLIINQSCRDVCIGLILKWQPMDCWANGSSREYLFCDESRIKRSVI